MTTATTKYSNRPFHRWPRCLTFIVLTMNATNLSMVDAFLVGPSLVKQPTSLVHGLMSKTMAPTSMVVAVPRLSKATSNADNDGEKIIKHWLPIATTTWMVSIMLFLATSSALPNMALAGNDVLVDSDLTVQNTIAKLRETQGNPDATFSVFEDVAAIITEGKGIGGAINYQGIQLDRGYVADEDTSIYNPGLTLLTEGEKEQLVQAILDSRRVGLQQNQWTENNQVAFDFLKGSLDPYHLSELRGYLGILPIYIAVWYLAVLAVQQVARQWFSVAYLVAAAAIFAPMLVLVALGPQ